MVIQRVVHHVARGVNRENLRGTCKRLPNWRTLVTDDSNSSLDRDTARKQPLSLGYIAGLQSTTNDGPWSSFDEAYGLLQQVDPEVLLEFETSLWEQDRMRFVYSTKEISVVDLYRESPETAGRAMRSLLFNARPKLIQSSIEVDCTKHDNIKVLWGKPPPLVGTTATHLGGLALAVPLWLAGRRQTRSSTSSDKPNALILGAGGCTIPSLLAMAGCNVTAVEPSDDVRHAALEYFGAADAGIELLSGFGEDYLLKRGSDKNECSSVDILIIDAEDGTSAPPPSMKQKLFWKDAVVPSLKSDAVVAVNVIADADTERIELKRMVAETMPTHDIWCCEVPSIAEVSDRHCIMFATPSLSIKRKGERSHEKGADDDMRSIKEAMEEFDYVDMPSEWIKEMELARNVASTRPDHNTS